MLMARHAVKSFASRNILTERLMQLAVHAKRKVRGDDLPRCLHNYMTLSEFFKSLEQQNVSYAIIHALDDSLEAMPDLQWNLLVADHDAATVDGLLVRSRKRRQRIINLYSVHGISGFRFNEISVFPPHLAERVLQRALNDHQGIRVPCLEDRFFSLAFHILYHLGPRASLQRGDGAQIDGRGVNRLYEDSLIRLAHELGLDLGRPVSMAALHDLLKRHGWSPPLDMLERFGTTNPWCAELTSAVYERTPNIPGLVVFIVRDDLAFSGRNEGVELDPFLESQGFVIIASKVLDPRKRLIARQQLRGANWGPETGPSRCGKPARVVVAVDPAPEGQLAPRKGRQLFGVDNARIVQVKRALRDMYRRNVVHASDNTAQAVHYLEVTVPEELDAVLAKARKLVVAQPPRRFR
jgi:hypothetical protein